MAIDFPASPTLNQTFSVGNTNYVWDGTKWTASVTGGISLDKIEKGNTKAEVVDTGTDGRFVVTTEGTEKLRVDSSGRVGVGTASPNATLTLAASASSTAALSFMDTTYNSYPAIFSTNNSTGEIRLGGVNTAGTYFLTLYTQNTERARIDSSGRLLVGTSSARSNFFNTTQSANIQLEGTSGTALMSLVSNADAAGGNAALILGKTRGTTVGSTTVVQSGDTLGRITFQGSDGTEFVQAADIYAEVDGTPGANDMPSRLVFSTTADGASSPTERMRITNAGYSKFSDNGNYTNATGTFHEFRSTASDVALAIRQAQGGSGGQGVIIDFSNQPNNTTQYHLRCMDSQTFVLRSELRSNGGLANYQANNVNLSDQNAKKDISPAADTWNCIKEWEIVNYRYKDQPDDADLNLGVIAQQVAESCPEVITVFQEATEDEPEKLGVKEQQMYWMAIKALQEAQVRIETLEQRLTDAGIA